MSLMHISLSSHCCNISSNSESSICNDIDINAVVIVSPSASSDLFFALIGSPSLGSINGINFKSVLASLNVDPLCSDFDTIDQLPEMSRMLISPNSHYGDIGSDTSSSLSICNDVNTDITVIVSLSPSSDSFFAPISSPGLGSINSTNFKFVLTIEHKMD